MAAPHGHLPTTANFENRTVALAQHFDQALDLAFDAGHLHHQRLRSEIDNAGAKDLGEFEDLRAVFLRGRYLNKSKLARDCWRLGNVVDINDILQLEQAGANAVACFCRSFTDQRETRKSRPLAAADGQRMDVDVQAAKQRSHARQHAGQVFNIGDECVEHNGSL